MYVHIACSDVGRAVRGERQCLAELVACHIHVQGIADAVLEQTGVGALQDENVPVVCARRGPCSLSPPVCPLLEGKLTIIRTRAAPVSGGRSVPKATPPSPPLSPSPPNKRQPPFHRHPLAFVC